MSLIPIIVGPFSNIFIGNAISTDVLIEITDITTGPSELYEGYDEKYFPGLNLQLQIGTYQVSVPFSFLDSSSTMVNNLARGLSVDNSDINTPPENTSYTLLLIGPDQNKQTSVLITPCRTKRDKKVNRSKTSATAINVLFTAEDPSRYSGLITYGTPAELATILAGRSPL